MVPTSFDFTPNQKTVRKLAMEFAQKEIAPRAAEIDEKEEIPRDLFEKIRKLPYRFTARACTLGSNRRTSDFTILSFFFR